MMAILVEMPEQGHQWIAVVAYISLTDCCQYSIENKEDGGM